jgi:hypothetical protein
MVFSSGCCVIAATSIASIYKLTLAEKIDPMEWDWENV